ncbi:MAG TPA: DNA polymerase III subunit delta, partial [Bacteroidales bacterium]|nr:DNA polymerase III subunit delta [Bacteroidales bacterium]
MPLEKAAEIARVSNGNINRAAELCRNEESSTAYLDKFRSLMRFAYKKDVISIISWSEEVAQSGREWQKGFVIYSLRLLRENLMLTLDQKKNNIVYLSDQEQDFSGKFHPFINQKNVDQLAEEFNLVHSHVEANGNAKIIFLDLGLKVTRLIR